ncbi:MAG: PAS domain-containing protein [Actinomycetota bacterium]
MSSGEHNLVLILARGLASSIATPMFLVDPEGTLVYFNEAAEGILGQTYAESGEMSPEEWGTAFSPEDPETGDKVDPQSLPLTVALSEQRPAHRKLAITGMDGERRLINITALPFFARTDEFVGAVAIFWQVDEAEG